MDRGPGLQHESLEASQPQISVHQTLCFLQVHEPLHLLDLHEHLMRFIRHAGTILFTDVTGRSLPMTRQ